MTIEIAVARHLDRLPRPARLGPVAPRGFVVLLALGLGCAAHGAGDGAEAPSAAEAVSLTGDTLFRPVLSPATRARFDSALDAARRAYQRAPRDLDSIVWLGRRTAYLGRYREAIGIYTRGLESHPDEPRLFRHRGHRYLSTRQLDQAVADFTRAAELIRGRPDRVEEDGLPNARGVPTSTLQSNVWYHLGLAHYVQGDFAAARNAYEQGLRVSTNPDMLTAMSYWLYLTERRLGDARAAAATLAAVRPDFDIIENGSYHRLMMLYQGRIAIDSLLPASDSLSLDDVTTGYGVGVWHLLGGRLADADRLFRRIVAARDQWPAFGYLAAEAELARRRSP